VTVNSFIEDENEGELGDDLNPQTASSESNLPASQRNSTGGSLLEAFDFSEDSQPHPAELLFKIRNLRDLVIKSDIPSNVVPHISRMLWKAERYQIGSLTKIVEWYLLTRLSTNRRAREEYLEAVMQVRRKDDEDDILSKLS